MRQPLAALLLAAACLAAPGSAWAQLTTLGDQLWHQDVTGIGNTAEEGDSFGRALASGDFDGDGFGDLAIGVPREGLSVASQGAVQVLYGGPAGLGSSGNQLWSQDSSGVPDAGEAFDEFGRALAAGDLDCDGFDDLAIGAYGEDLQGAFNEIDAGVVHVLWGSSSGLTAATGGSPSSTLLDQDDFLPSARFTANDQFGRSLAIGEIRTGSVVTSTFLAVGSPGEDVGLDEGAGAVFLYTTSCGSRALAAGRILHQDVEEGGVAVAGAAEPFDRFGSALAAGDFNGDGRDDLAVGVPGEDVDGNAIASAGAVAIFYSAGSSGPRVSGNQLFDQGTTGIPGSPNENEFLGEALAAGDFDADGRDDLAVGIPEDQNGGAASGSVLVLYGGSGGLDPADSQSWTSADFGTTPSAAHGFGHALAAGNFDGDTEDDLAIGDEDFPGGGGSLAGRVYVLYGAFGGLGTNRAQTFRQGEGGLGGTTEPSDNFGGALAVGDFDGSGLDDLAVGVPGQDLGTFNAAGAVATLYGAANGVLGRVKFAQFNSSFVEAGASRTVALRRTGSALLSASVSVQRTGGTATPGVDFTFSPAVVTWAAGDLADKTVTISTIDDDLEEGDETVLLGLFSPSPGTELDNPTQHTFSIQDNDEGGVLAFSASSFAALENAGTATITVARTGGAAGGVTVQFVVAAGTATAGSDFQVASGTLIFNGGESAKSFSVTLLNDALPEEYETVLLGILSPTGGATLGAGTSAILYIRDDDSPAIRSDGFESGSFARWSAVRN